MARWLEVLAELDFEIQYHPGKLYGNADAHSCHPSTMVSCCHCCRMEEQDRLAKAVAAAHTTLHDQAHQEDDCHQFISEQHSEPVLAWVREWMGEGRRLGWQAISASKPETKACHFQWDNLEERDGLLYRCW